MRQFLIAAAALATLGLAVPATAQASIEESIDVPYRDLNLHSVEGQQALDGRIDRAARKVCGMGEQRTATRLRNPVSVECYRQARLKAREQVARIRNAEALGG